MTKQYVVYLSNKQKHLMSEQLIVEHVEYLRSLKQQGSLPFCGPCKDGTALMIINASSQEEAERLLSKDPFSKVDYYQDRKIVEVEEATIKNNFHLEHVIAYLRSLTQAVSP